MPHADAQLWRNEAPSTRLFEDACATLAPVTREWIYGEAAIGFVLAGCFEYSTPQGGGLAAPGSIVLGNAGERFGVRHLDTLGNHRLVVSLPKDVLQSAANDIDADARFTGATLAPGRDAMRLFALMRTLSEPGAEDLIHAIAALALAPQSPRKSKRASAEDERRVRGVIAYVDAHFDEPCTLNDLAERAQLSRYHFLRTFAAILGVTPARYVISTRLRAAAERLINTRTPITEIAFDVGYNDISHFYAGFRAALGCTPKQWRERRAISPKTLARA